MKPRFAKLHRSVKARLNSDSLSQSITSLNSLISNTFDESRSRMSESNESENDSPTVTQESLMERRRGFTQTREGKLFSKSPKNDRLRDLITYSALKKVNRVFILRLRIISGEDLVVRDASGTSDPFVKIRYDGRDLGRTKVVAKNLHPIWNEVFEFKLTSISKNLELRVFDKDTFFQDFMGTCFINLSDLNNNEEIDMKIPLYDDQGTAKEDYFGKIHVKIYLMEVENDDIAALNEEVFAAKSTLQSTFQNSSHPLTLKKFNSVERFQKVCSSTHSCDSTECIEDYRIRPNLAWSPDVFSINSAVQLASKCPEEEIKFQSGVIHIVLISGSKIFLNTNKRLRVTSKTDEMPLQKSPSFAAADPDSPQTKPDCYVCFKYGNLKKRSKVIKQSNDPVWREEFDFKINQSSNSILEIFLRHEFSTSKLASPQRSTDIAVASLNLENFPFDLTEVLEVPCETSYGSRPKIKLAITLTGLSDAVLKEGSPINMNDGLLLANSNEEKEVDAKLSNHYSLRRTLDKIKDIGWVKVKLLKAKNLPMRDVTTKMDPYFVIQMPSYYARTQTFYKSAQIEVNRTFIFPIEDIADCIRISVHDDRVENTLIGQIWVPLLEVKNNKKMNYTLRNDKGEFTKSNLSLEMHVKYNILRAAIQALQEPEEDCLKLKKKFRLKRLDDYISSLKESGNRIYKFVDMGKMGGLYLIEILSWERPFITAFVYFLYNMGIWFCEPYMIPLSIVLGLLGSNVVKVFQGIFHRFAARIEVKVDTIALMEDNDSFGEFDEDEIGIKEIKDENKQNNMRTRWKSIQIILNLVEEKVKFIAEILEKIYGIFNWSSPWISWLLLILLSIVTLVFYLLPFRVILTLLGMKFFLKPLLFPNLVDTNELFNLVSRIPTLVEIENYKEVRDVETCSHSATQRPSNTTSVKKKN